MNAPKRNRKIFGGKRGYHTLKSQLVADQNTEEIICVFCGKGRGHDFSLFKKSSSFSSFNYQHRRQWLSGNSAYHSNSYTPKKKSKNRKLTELEKEYNKALAKERIIIEPINRKLKIFKILSCKYRNRRRRYSLRVNLLAAIYNCELGIGIAAS
ncbi:transposase family protein [Microcystis aeruginosa]|uniref:transposase family protein n=1 Tax=Microcystis aeruginosa TaxID=1126 RepID=UPI003B3AA35D